MLKTFEDCQTKFEFRYVKNLSIPQRSTFFEKGKKIHALANYYLSDIDITKMEKVLSESENLVWQKLKANKYFSYEKIGTEYNLACKIEDFWTGGRLDALVKSKNDYIILDY